MKQDFILVVDDNHELGGFISETLLPSFGYRSKQVFDGASALIAIHELKPSLLLLDLDLPDISGLDLLRRLKNEGISVPAILFTAHGSEQIVVEAFQLGVEDYLIKPVEPDQLAASIGRALEETRLRREKTLLVSELNEQVNWLSSLSKIGQSVTSTLDLDEVLRRIVEAAVQLTQADEGFLALLDHSTGTLYLRASKNIDGQISSSLRLPIADSLLGETLTTGKPMRKITQMVDQPIKIGTGLLVNSLMNVPILSKGRPLGVLSVDNRKNPQGFTQREEIILTSLADYAAIALENASLYQQARHEIVERKRIESALRESEERYALAARGANDGIWDLDLKKNRLYCSPRWKEMLGFQEHEIGDSPNEWFNRVHQDDIEALKSALTALINGRAPHLEAEYRIRHKDNTFRWMLSRGVAVQGSDGGIGRIAGSQTDISERKSVEARLLHDAFHDKLTSLPNRALFIEHLQKAIRRSEQESDYNFAVLFLDLDQFKFVNDSLGHPSGDQLLIAIAQVLKNSLRRSDTVARLSGDEFVILLDGIHDETDAREKSLEIMAALEKPIKLGSHECFISTSIGVVLSSLGYSRPEDVLRDADIAMYVAKSKGKSRFQLFDPEMRREIIQRLSLEADIQHAMAENQFEVSYQPIVSLKNGQLIGFEALVHWMHPKHGLIPASDFLPIAQETGQILQIDWWVFEEACTQIQNWHKLFSINPPLVVSVNLANSILAHTDLIQSIQANLKKTGLPAKNLVLEIAESVISVNVDSLRHIITDLKALGMGVQIDDFGKGQSSLLYLNDLQVDALKIDRAFMNRISNNGKFTEIPRMIISLAHSLEIKTIAEGIEESDQLTRLRELNCDYGQGFLICSPLGKMAAQQLLEAYHHLGCAALPWKHYWQEVFA